ncbi:hypothetical protein SAMD00019534_034790 [Acytostelium subglobosum LB1]|uniref:hypothetical protein n=1 Tax=Acytostelium subglobosum LB1 TaxID=1410327 RepID=UPI000644A2B1|nr:hypothetical protein SAMD00019534_034790 [Acytostelium subglobosum LB1]GAM20304.1 hypothetical protein SAMD00019534_034790 [Acytostelium subglobosum LB1]|eukprot:XP_012759825.1 hypothetical protein SAMD00019534_034790 [Acytostelium subglobosum LB1]
MEDTFFKKITGEYVERKAYTMKVSERGEAPITGAFFLTNFRIAFGPSDKSKRKKEFIDMPISSIAKFERSSPNKKDRLIEIHSKEIRSYKFLFSSDELVEELERKFLRLHPLVNEKVFAFYNFEKYPNTKGARIYDAVQEFQRQGISSTPTKNCQWFVTNANSDYGLCETYPRILAVPSGSQELLSKVACYRTNKRLPVLCWRHPKKSTIIARSSQPKVGVSKNNCPEDEKLISLIVSASGDSWVTVVDARPMVNALANRAKGAGYENVDRYENTVLEFAGIGNIHAMRDSFKKLRDSILGDSVSDNMRYLSNLENSHWLEHLSLLIETSVRIAEKVDSGTSSVLIHCSDGWDRTSQLSALSMLLLDGYYRTLEGFIVLIEKEWLSFGHMFWRRTHGKGADDRSPIFLQFIDCVWQICNQYPKSFEFNERLLVDILDALYSSQFGTFLYDSEKERLRATQLPSLWSHVEVNRANYINILYQNDDRSLEPVSELRHMRLFEPYYCRLFSHTTLERSEASTELALRKETTIKSISDELAQLKAEKEIADQRNADLLVDSVKLHTTIEDLKRQILIKTQICESREKEMLNLRKEKDSLLEVIEANHLSVTGGAIDLTSNGVTKTTTTTTTGDSSSSSSNSSSNQQTSIMDYSIKSLQNRITTLEFNQSLLQSENVILKSDHQSANGQLEDIRQQLKLKESKLEELSNENEKQQAKLEECERTIQANILQNCEHEAIMMTIISERDQFWLQLQETKSGSSNNVISGGNNYTNGHSNGNGNSENGNGTDVSMSDSTSSINNNNNGQHDSINNKSTNLFDFFVSRSHEEKDKDKIKSPSSTAKKATVNSNNNNNTDNDNNNTESKPIFSRLRGFSLTDTLNRKPKNQSYSTAIRSLEIIDDYTSEKRTAPDESSSSPPLGLVFQLGSKKLTERREQMMLASDQREVCTGCNLDIPRNRPYYKRKDKVHCEQCEKDFTAIKHRNQRCTTCDKPFESNPKRIGDQLYCKPCVKKIITSIDDLGF